MEVEMEVEMEEDKSLCFGEMTINERVDGIEKG
jgi:hypothetical protein